MSKQAMKGEGWEGTWDMWIETSVGNFAKSRWSVHKYMHKSYIKWYSRKFIQSRRLKSFAPQFYFILTFWRVEWRERQSGARGKEALRRNSWSWGWLNWVNSAITLVTWRFTSYGYKWQKLKVNLFVQGNIHIKIIPSKLYII